MMLDLRSTANSSVRAKMIEPSLGLIVIPVQAHDKRRAGDDLGEDHEGDEGSSETTHSWHSGLV